MMELNEKYLQLQNELQKLGKIAVAFSSGVDSTFLLKAAVETLGRENVIAITTGASVFPEREQQETVDFCKENEIEHILFKIDPLEIEGFKENPINRCYLCKYHIFSKMKEIAKEKGFTHLVEGSNMDDLGDYRPGLMAIEELGILSPLRMAELTKAEIRELSKKMNLSTWEKPSFACLASRFVYGEEITEEKLRMVEQAEVYLMGCGYRQFRVRIHGKKPNLIARVEILPEEFDRFMVSEDREKTEQVLKDLGFAYVTLDLRGYRTGSMNETLV